MSSLHACNDDSRGQSLLIQHHQLFCNGKGSFGLLCCRKDHSLTMALFRATLNEKWNRVAMDSRLLTTRLASLNPFMAFGDNVDTIWLPPLSTGPLLEYVQGRKVRQASKQAVAGPRNCFSAISEEISLIHSLSLPRSFLFHPVTPKWQGEKVARLFCH